MGGRCMHRPNQSIFDTDFTVYEEKISDSIKIPFLLWSSKSIGVPLAQLL